METVDNIQRQITNGESRMVDINKGKHVNVNLLFSEYKLYIQDGTIFQNTFRYVMSKAKNPRKQYIHQDAAVHSNIAAGYYIVNPINIIL